MGHESSSPSGVLAASSADSHMDGPEVSNLATKVASSQQESWKPVKPRRIRKSTSKDAKAGMIILYFVSGLVLAGDGYSPLDS
ncbi:hypothetical protein Nepgr_007832 [Nepenthes gracilis]|uniref:Uncharacterized protein n=1 Tax=Nepenthes gracilis TaxID=150966 RepID=A0AAD3S7L1_NEPGR|nr:hypothetical protein Nepgr_007832 [Nepenthes gracilis]